MDRRLLVAALTAAALLTVSTSARAQAPRPTPIHDIQGNGASSPVVGMTLTIQAVVTGVDDEIGSDFERSARRRASGSPSASARGRRAGAPALGAPAGGRSRTALSARGARAGA